MRRLAYSWHFPLQGDQKKKIQKQTTSVTIWMCLYVKHKIFQRPPFMFRLICYKRLFFYFISHCSAAYFLKVYTCRSSAAEHTPTQTTTTGHCPSFRWRIWWKTRNPKCFIYLQSHRLLLVVIFIRLERFVSVMTTIFCCYVKRFNWSVAKLRIE